ncbi:MAG: hypothetical protein ACRD6N_06695 [Pyrinomonadaceae bacterium]
MLPVTVEQNRIRFGDRFSVFFLRTLRVPDDGRTYPLPPGLDEFSLHRVDDYPRILSSGWVARGDVFIPMYQREAMWLGFEAASWKPNAVMVGTGAMNAVTGSDWDKTLRSDPQNYLVCPPQPWLDGFNTGSGIVRQFVATPLGSDLTVESQLTGAETGGLRLLVFEPRRGHFPESRPKSRATFQPESVTSGMMGLAAGGEIRQKIYSDPHGLDVWDSQNFGSVRVHIVNSEQCSLLTGLMAPPTPIDAGTYTQYGFPWFQLYDEKLPDVPAAERLAGVKTLLDKEMEHEGSGKEREETVDVPEPQVRPLRPPKTTENSQE